MTTLSEIRERYPHPTVTTEVYGVTHAYCNLQEAMRVSDRFFEIATQSSGVPTIYIESAHGSIDNTDQHTDMIQKLGFTSTYLQLKIASREGRRASESELASLIAAIEQTANADAIVRQKLLAIDDLYAFVGFTQLDKLKELRPFNYRFEAHEKGRLRKSMTYESLGFSKESEAFYSFNAGNLGNAISLQRESLDAFLLSFRIRERAMVDDITEISNDLQKGNGGTILFPVGFLHIPITDTIEKRNTRGKRSTKTQRLVAKGVNTVDGDIYNKLRAFERPTDLECAQSLLLRMISSELQQFLISNGLIEVVGNRYGDIYPYILEVVKDLDFSTIQQLSNNPNFYRTFLDDIMREVQQRASN